VRPGDTCYNQQMVAKRRSKHKHDKRRLALLLGLGLVVALLLVWLLWPGQRIVAGAPNLIVISLDTLRADHLGCYGYARNTTPNIDRLAAGGVLFEQALSQSPWTLPAHASLFTSLYPSRHGVHQHDLALRKGDKLLAEVLQRAGYLTAGFVDVFLISRKYGFQRGFDRYVDQGEDEGARKKVDQAINWLNERTSPQPFFLFMHLYDPHSAYRAPAPFLGKWSGQFASEFEPDTDSLFDERLGKRKLSELERSYVVARYDEEIAYADAELGRLFSYLEELGIDENTAIVLLSDHGEEFLEHGGVLHGVSLYDELIMVPLIIRLPGERLAGRRIREQVQIIDLAPTLIEIAGLESPRSFQGISLLPYIEGKGSLRGYGGFSEADHMDPGHNVKRCLRTNQHKYYYDINTERGMLFDLVNDPGEKQDLATAQPELSERLSRELFSWMETRGDERRSPELSLSTAEQERLRSLGYLQ